MLFFHGFALYLTLYSLSMASWLNYFRPHPLADGIDRLNYLITALVLFISCIIVSAEQSVLGIFKNILKIDGMKTPSRGSSRVPKEVE